MRHKTINLLQLFLDIYCSNEPIQPIIDGKLRRLLITSYLLTNILEVYHINQ